MDPFDYMQQELDAFCAAFDLEPESADEMLCNDDLSPFQRDWLLQFVQRWDDHAQQYPATARSHRNSDARSK